LNPVFIRKNSNLNYIEKFEIDKKYLKFIEKYIKENNITEKQINSMNIVKSMKEILISMIES
jgi:hypothetical protein